MPFRATSDRPRPFRLRKDVRSRSGILVTKRHGWVVPCSKMDEVLGVYQTLMRQVVYLLDGTRTVYELPARIVIQGNADIAVGN